MLRNIPAKFLGRKSTEMFCNTVLDKYVQEYLQQIKKLIPNLL